ncbi:MAG TPA: hypothetical protein VM222_04860 [Planctomycetota bacterium]|nr:hypothetical protein [Planctomycetota bacterium]
MIELLAMAALVVLADDAAAAALLTQAGGKVKSDAAGAATEVYFKDSSALTTEHYRAIGGLRKLRKLTLYNQCSLTDETLAPLSTLEALEELEIDGAKITDGGLKAFSSLKSLRKCTFYHVLGKEKFTGSGIAHLAELPRFESFGCGGSSFNDEGMAACAKLPHLRELRIWHTLASDAGVAKLTGMTSLKIVHLGPQFTPRITDASVASLAAIKSLETVSVMETRLTWEKSLSKLKDLPALKLLELQQDEISEADLAKVRAALPGVKVDYKAPTDEQKEWLRRNYEPKKK